MSVLSFPRIYFKGYISWDPSTVNNNDYWQTYAAAQAALDWQFLQNAPGLTAIGATTISPENFRETFRRWAIIPEVTPPSEGPTSFQPPCEWNMFGTHAVNFVQYQNNVSLVTGGATAPTGPYSMITDDPFVGATVGLTGNNAPAVMVDNNPVSPWSTQIYWGELSFGNGGLALRLPMNYRMFLRWVDFARTYPQGPPSGCFQTAVPYEQVTWPTNGASPLVDALQAAAKQAKGIMVRFTAYNLQFNQNGVFNDIPIQPSNPQEYVQALSSAWQQWNENQSTTGFFSNPAITNVVGTIGVWNEGELASMPGGRYFVAQNPIAPAPTGSTGLPKSAGDDNDLSVPTGIRIPPEMLVAAAAATGPTGPPTIPLGPAVAEINGKLVSLDFSSTIPEVAGALTKANFGPLSLGVLTSGGLIQELAVIDYAHYGQTAYQTTSGIIDLPLWGSGPFEGPLVISAGDNIALQETIFDAQTDSRGIYLDQGGATAIDINVYQRGVLSPGGKVLVARYGQGVQLGTANQTLPLVAAGPTAATATYTSNVQVVNFTTGAQSTISVTGPTSTVDTNVTVLDADANGVAQLGLTAQAPGFVALAFFPYGPTGATPTPPLNLTNNITYADYTTIRVLPFDDNVPQLFVDFWNGLTGPTADKREKAWDFIYNPTLPNATIPSGGGILYLYDQLFNVMLEHVDLGSLTAVEAAKVPIWNRIAPNSAAEGSSNMPITRDMSAGKRTTLQLWIYLAANNYNVETLSLTAIDGWSPTSPASKG